MVFDDRDERRILQEQKGAADVFKQRAEMRRQLAGGSFNGVRAVEPFQIGRKLRRCERQVCVQGEQVNEPFLPDSNSDARSTIVVSQMPRNAPPHMADPEGIDSPNTLFSKPILGHHVVRANMLQLKPCRR
jgi:hypothetical protein